MFIYQINAALMSIRVFIQHIKTIVLIPSFNGDVYIWMEQVDIKQEASER